MVVGCGLAIAAAAVAAARWSEREGVRDLRDALGRTQDAYASYLQSRVDFFSLMPELIASSREVVDFMAAPNDPRAQDIANRYLSGFATTGRIAVAYVIAPNGVTVAASNWNNADSFVGQNYAFRPYFTNALAGGRGHQIAIGATSKAPGYYVSAPVTAGGRILGVAVLKYELDRLLSWKSGHEKVMLADGDGVIFLSSDPAFLFRTLRPLAKADHDRLVQARKYGDQPLSPIPIFSERRVDGVRLVTLEPSVLVLPEDSAQQMPAEYVLDEQKLTDSDWRLVVLTDAGIVHDRVFTVRISLVLLVIVFGLVGLYIEQRRRYLRALVANAIRDPLTGLYTRLYMNDVVTKQLETHDRGKLPGIGVVVFDLDHFKRINDTHGHAAGDAVLAGVAAVILEEVRGGDVPVRFGGEELAVFLPVARLAEAITFAERVREKVSAKPFSIGSESLHVTLSGGVVLRRNGETIGDLIIRADHLLYVAKHQGRNLVLAEQGGPNLVPEPELAPAP